MANLMKADERLRSARAILAIAFLMLCGSASAQMPKDLVGPTKTKCELITEEEAERVLGLPLKPSQPAYLSTAKTEGYTHVQCTFGANTPKRIYLHVSKAEFGSDTFLRRLFYGGEATPPREFKREPGLGDEAYSWKSAEQNFEIAIRVKRSIVYVDYASLSGDYGVPPTAEQIARVKALAARLAKTL